MPKITFLATGETHEVPAGTALVEFCQENDAPQEFGCTVGSCGTCAVMLTVGADAVNPITEDEQDTLDMVTNESGARLACQLEVNGDIAIRDATDLDEGGPRPIG